jgi:methylisocitrate lyase
MLFPEAVEDLATYAAFVQVGQVPVLANLTEFGQTPLFSLDELASAGVGLALYPLTAFRAMSAAAQNTYKVLRRDGSQRSMLPYMQTRAELYEVLGYHAYENKLDELFAKEKTNE